MRIAILKTSMKENERRVPVYPEHLPRFSAELRRKMVFEETYGSDYGYPDEYLIGLGSSVANREDLLDTCDVIVLPKPTYKDLANMREGQVLFGWPHCVQQQEITQAAIDNKLTVIAWEAMFAWGASGERLTHLFYKNNEIAGYAAVIHCLQLLGIDGYYGPRRKVVVLGHGSVSRGAIYALQGRGFNNIHVYTKRAPIIVGDQNPDIYSGQYYQNENGVMMVRNSEGDELEMIEELSTADIICNGIMQDPNQPVMFVKESEVNRLKPRSIIIDISCDEGMAFPFAKPTTFDDPTFKVSQSITYYSVDHTPTYLWNAASREISRVMLHILEKVAQGDKAWDAHATIQKAIELRGGVIKNPAILRFQRRKDIYPHEVSC